MARGLAAAFAVLLAVVVGAGLWAAAPASAAAPTLAGVVSALEKNPVYLDPAAGPPQVDAARLRAVIPKGTYFAALPAADLAALPASAAGNPAALPAFLSAQVGKGGTFVVLMAGKLYGSSTTAPGSLGDELGAAQSALPSGGDPTAVLVALMRSLSGSGTLSDATGPSRAGGPVGPELLVAFLIVLAIGALALWWWLRRPPRRRKPRPAPPLRDLVEIDYHGNIVRHTPARDRQR